MGVTEEPLNLFSALTRLQKLFAPHRLRPRREFLVIHELPGTLALRRFCDASVELTQPLSHIGGMAGVVSPVGFTAENVNEEHQNTVARPERLELPTFWFVARRSIQLSYGRAQKILAQPLPRFHPPRFLGNRGLNQASLSRSPPAIARSFAPLPPSR
jgi:hypothetical protein